MTEEWKISLKMSHHSSSGSIEGLPKQFVTSLRILFDILDEDRAGYVRLCDIESRWHEEGVKGLPSGVIETLRKVAPQNGRLSFENFVTGLKLSLLKTPSAFNSGKENKGLNGVGNEKPVPVRDKNVPKNTVTGHQEKFTNQISRRAHSEKIGNPQDRQIGRRAQQNLRNVGRTVGPNTVAVRPNNALNIQSQNVELRSQIYQQNREHQQVSSQFRNRSTDVYQNPDRNLDKHVNDRLQGENEAHLRKDYTKLQHSRPKSEEIFRGHAVNQQRPPPRPEHPPPYHHARSPEMAPPAIPPRDRNRRIMQELKAWHREHTDSNNRFPTSSSDSKLVEQNHMSANAIYGRYLLLR